MLLNQLLLIMAMLVEVLKSQLLLIEIYLAQSKFKLMELTVQEFLRMDL